MSIVGTRPPTLDEWNKYELHHRARLALPFGPQENGQSNDLVQKYRDILKSAVVMQEDEAAYILLGIENQTDIHYAMPVRNMIYDALQYGKQVADTAANHRIFFWRRRFGKKRLNSNRGFYQRAEETFPTKC